MLELVRIDNGSSNSITNEAEGIHCHTSMYINLNFREGASTVRCCIHVVNNTVHFVYVFLLYLFRAFNLAPRIIF